MAWGSDQVEKSLHAALHCQLSNYDLEKSLTISSNKIRLFVSNKEVEKFIENDNCNAFIRALLKIQHSEENMADKLFSYENIESDIISITEASLRVLSYSAIGDLAILYNDNKKAIYFAERAKRLLQSFNVISNTDASAVFSLSKLYARLGDLKMAYSIANKLEGEEKESLVYELNRFGHPVGK